MPGGRLGLKVALAFVGLPVVVGAVAWLDRPGENTFQMRGVITDIRTEVVDSIPSTRIFTTVRLSDGSMVQCRYIIGSSIGAEVAVHGAQSRLFGRRSITC